ncbi:copper-translocating P-type ATPase [Pseudomonas sp. WN033]|nr:copper-translocating P-type ATPase [Pseudomonas sp. WN033]
MSCCDNQPQAPKPEIQSCCGADGCSDAESSSRWGRWRLAAAGLVALAAEVLHLAGLAGDWRVAALALLSILLCGLGTYKAGWLAIRRRELNINALMSVAVTGAMLIGEWPEAAMVMFLFTIAELIEARSLERARRAIGSLLDLSPEQAWVLQSDGQWRDLPVAEVAVGDRVRVRPGERIALDGEVLSGHSSINQAPITGESLPVDKRPGDALFAGSLNQQGELEYRVTAPASDSTLARIIRAVEQAQASQAPTQRFIDRFARIYTPAVFALALLVAVVPALFVGDWLEWIYRALVLLVVACPCALVISTPVTVVSGLTRAARLGILIKGGRFLEAGRELDCLALDKTGTLTLGQPELTDVEALNGRDAEPLFALAASLAGRSDHPVSGAISRAAMGQLAGLQAVEGFTALLGSGVRGRIAGQDYWLGNRRLLDERGLLNASLEQLLQALERQGKSVVVLADTQQPLALFAVADQLKSGSREAVSRLTQAGVQTHMLSGDNPHAAQTIAAQAGIDQAYAELLPEHKLDLVERWQAEGRKVGMVGDGINDAPALAQADIGFAMVVAGTDTAMETADVALMDDDLGKIPTFIQLSRATVRILRQNIALAVGIKALFLLLTLTGHTTLWMAVFADMGVSLLVVFNGLRLLRWGTADVPRTDELRVAAVPT